MYWVLLGAETQTPSGEQNLDSPGPPQVLSPQGHCSVKRTSRSHDPSYQNKNHMMQPFKL